METSSWQFDSLNFLTLHVADEHMVWSMGDNNSINPSASYPLANVGHTNEQSREESHRQGVPGVYTPQIELRVLGPQPLKLGDLFWNWSLRSDCRKETRHQIFLVFSCATKRKVNTKNNSINYDTFVTAKGTALQNPPASQAANPTTQADTSPSKVAQGLNGREYRISPMYAKR